MIKKAVQGWAECIWQVKGKTYSNESHPYED